MNKYEKAIHILINREDYWEEQIETALDILQELVERATPKKAIREKNTSFINCPEGEDYTYYENQPYCVGCGQALDWSE